MPNPNKVYAERRFNTEPEAQAYADGLMSGANLLAEPGSEHYRIWGPEGPDHNGQFVVAFEFISYEKYLELQKEYNDK